MVKNNSKKIALLADGTGNSSASPHKTNVWRLYKAIDISPGANQHAFYDDGVGTNPFRPLAIIGLTLGWGLAANVRQLYGNLCRTYEPGDKIYIFGFSRGAFTARVLAALITSQGIIDYRNVRDERDMERLVLAAYRRFRKEAFTPSMLSFVFAPFRDVFAMFTSKRNWEAPYKPHKMNLHYCDDENCGAHQRYRSYWHWAFYQWYPSNWFKDQPACSGTNSGEPLVEFLGVWDTVDAYGGPIDEMTNAWDKVVWPLQAKDRVLSARVERACHALSLDEQRLSFAPMLWDETNEKVNKTSKHIRDERITQVWFSGVHANVGGGYPDDSLARVSLDWMMKQCGLKFVAEQAKQIKVGTNPYGPIYDNRAGLGNAYRYQPRNLDALSYSKKPGLAMWIKEKLPTDSEQHNIAQFDRPKIHRSVFDRIVNGNDGYAPINLPEKYVVVDKAGNISRPPEKPAEAKKRKERQEFTWNKVWLLKFIYLILLVTVTTFVIYPFWTDAHNVVDNSKLEGMFQLAFGTLSGVIRTIPEYISKIPGLGFIRPWTDKWNSFPFQFLIFLLIIGPLVWSGLWVNSKVKTEMRRNWFALTKMGARPRDQYSRYRKFWRVVLNYKGYFSNYAIGNVKAALEAFFVVVFVLLSFTVFSRAMFVFLDGTGGICKETIETGIHLNEARQTNLPLGKVGEFSMNFDPKEPCFASGVKVQAGNEYRIKLVVTNELEWRDKDNTADLRGLQNVPWYFYPAIIIRRHVTVDWFQPVVRVGTKLFDRYPLEHEPEKLDVKITAAALSQSEVNQSVKSVQSADLKSYDPECRHEFAANKPLTLLCKKINPLQTGELFIYVNDAVLIAPRYYEEFYNNNAGEAVLTIKDLGPVSE